MDDADDDVLDLGHRMTRTLPYTIYDHRARHLGHWELSFGVSSSPLRLSST